MTEADHGPRRQRRSFGPVVLAGLGSGALAAVAGHRAWAGADAAGEAGRLAAVATGQGAGAGEVPAAGALALVVLAAWGVLLVTRGRVRRLVAGVAVLAAVGYAAAVVVGFGSAPDGVRRATADLGLEAPDVGRTAWYWVAALAAFAVLVTTKLAWRLVPSWPEMGSRYDAPGGDSADTRDRAAEDPGTAANVELWKAMDEGRDPTA